MDQLCTRCNAALPPDAKFCMNCGQAVEPVTAVDDERHSRLRSAAPNPLVEKMRAPRLTGERKPVTALFADIVGSTALAETMDPEDWTSIVNGAFEAMSAAIFRYEGTIAKLMGDAILAFFGAPVAHEDDPERAVRAALEMLDDIRAYGETLKAQAGIDFQVRIGINTGQVLVGNVGSDLRYEYTALGDAVNVAARMQTAAEPGTVLVTGGTYRFVQNAFEATDLGEIEVKGKAEPVQAYRITGLRAERRSSRGLAGLESPMVGRDVPLAQLRGLLQVVAAGRGRVAFILAEAGIGKTRLLREFRTAAAEPAGATWAEGRSLSYGLMLPYHLLIDLVRSVLGVPSRAEEPEVRAALRERVGTEDGAYAVLGHLLSVQLTTEQRAGVDQLEAQTLQAAYLKWIRWLLSKVTADHPLVLVCEDIHWADSTSVDALIRLLPLVEELPILLICTGRPDRESPGWRLVSEAQRTLGASITEIALSPLTEAESRELVANLLVIESLPARVRDFILRRAEGNPFFVEEVIRMLIDREAIVRDGENWTATSEVENVDIPDTLQGLLLARIDRLPEEARRTLRVASVIGRQFSVRVLEEVLERSSTQ